MLSLVGFTLVANEENNDKNTKNINIEETKDITEEAISLVDYQDKGDMVASWYGPKFHGRLTANGEVYDQMALTAAHKSLKFGTLLKITNPKNGKSVIVRINDRGPYIKGRNLDLSKGAALALDMMHQGVQKVKVEEIKLKGLNFPVIALN